MTHVAGRNETSMGTNYIADLRFHDAERRQAESRYEVAVKKAFPVGSNIHSGKHGRGIVAAEVIAHGYGDRLKIRSQTGAEYWVTAYHVVEAGLNSALV